MSRLGELMGELCPDGVEFAKLKDVLTIKNGRDYKAFSTGSVPVYGSGGIMAYTDTSAYDKPSVLIPRKGSLNKLYYVDGPFWNVDTIFYTEINTTKVLPKYVYYWLAGQHLERLNKAGGVPSLTQAVLNEVVIPVPPLPIQRELVPILDKFADTNHGLIAELTAELAARKKQYQYYQDFLLDCAGAPKASLSECCVTIADGDHQPPPKVKSGIPFITISNINSCKKIDFSNTMFVPEKYYDGLDSKRRAQTDDILYTVVGSYGTPVYIDKDYKFVFQRHIAILRPDKKRLMPKYLYYAMQSSMFHRQAESAAVGAAQKTISLTSLNNMKIPVPDFLEQARIVAILDRFDTICNNLAIGLPAGIEARRKQYEYYREKLLTFKEKEPV